MRVSFEGQCTVARAGELRASLLQALNAGEPLELDCKNVADMDLTFCQLIHAVRASCQERGLTCRLEGNLPNGLAGLANQCGLPELAGPQPPGNMACKPEGTP